MNLCLRESLDPGRAAVAAAVWAEPRRVRGNRRFTWANHVAWSEPEGRYRNGCRQEVRPRWTDLVKRGRMEQRVIVRMLAEDRIRSRDMVQPSIQLRENSYLA